jgi:universal stress protein A
LLQAPTTAANVAAMMADRTAMNFMPATRATVVPPGLTRLFGFDRRLLTVTPKIFGAVRTNAAPLRQCDRAHRLRSDRARYSERVGNYQQPRIIVFGQASAKAQGTRVALNLLIGGAVEVPGQQKIVALERVLVATDFGSSASAAVQYGAELARLFRAKLHLVHVVGDRRIGTAMAGSVTGLAHGSMQAAVEGDGVETLDTLASDLRSRSLDVTPEILRDTQPARAITAYARANSIDLIVIGTHGRSGLAEFFLGSVAQHIVRTAHCPTLIVPGSERELVQHDAPSE